MVACILDKTLLIVSGGLEAVPGIKRAKEMGLYVVVSDMNPDAPGFEYADDILLASTYDIDRTLDLVKKYNTRRKINGVISIASDVPLTVATIAKELELPGIPVTTAILSTDKLKMKSKFLERNIPIPWFSAVRSLEHLKEIIQKKGYPLVLKPVDSRGARGVLKLESDINLQWAYNHSLSNSSSGQVMIEKFLEGPQFSTEALIIDSIGYPIGFSERNYELLSTFSPYIIENGGQQPAGISSKDKADIENLAIEAGIALGVVNGIIKGDMVLSEAGPKVVEIATRLSGGWFSTDQIPLATGVDLIGNAIKLALGEKIKVEDLIPKYQKGVAIRYFFPETGILKEILNLNEYIKKEWVYKIGFFIKPGEVIQEVTNHTKRAGFVITQGKTRDEAVKRAQEAIDNIKLITC